MSADTDLHLVSVFCPPLLIAFLFCTVWTLIVHTLRSEALLANPEVRRSFLGG